jgi:precorrin-3B synthase
VPPSSTLPAQRSRRDRCPGVLRPWPAADGALVRLRLIGGRLSGASLAALSRVAQQYGDGDVHLTRRANLQLRGLPSGDDGMPENVVQAIAATGLLPTRSHELVRNVMVSPLSGRGSTSLWPVADRLDQLLCDDASLAALPGRFLFVLDDGRGDLASRSCDLGLVALDASHVQLRVGSGWGPVVLLDDAAGLLVDLARRFLDVRGEGQDAPWHVAELPQALVPVVEPTPGALASSPPLPHGPVDGGTHVPVPDGVLDAELAERLSRHADLVVTPWHGVLTTNDEVA